ncbi:hypothetical protein [Allofranklinella schreckenbergeri]|uniref:hypothetical protein n=1 Tax=Allofranklinella schreckenbergeri TaxID=1076744 RepID=UPI001EEDE405|nr:hypothetical protein [Allofranklinella schreckenbergeri]
MIAFLLSALLINAAALAALALARHRLARWPMPGLWWLLGITLATVLTLQSARAFLP